MSLSQQLVKDVSPKALKKAVLTQSTQQPLTVYPAAMALLGAAYGLLFDLNMFSIGAMIVGGVLTSASWIWEYFVKGNSHASLYIKRYREELEQKRQLALQQLEGDLKDVHDTQGIKQIQSFKDKYRNFLDILNRKLDQKELTYQRYLTIAEQVFLGGLDNLENAALALKSVSAIDVNHIEGELQKLEKQSSNEAESRKSALSTRLSLRKNQLDRVSQLLLENEQALTQLDHVAAKLADAKTQAGRAQVDLEIAMKELQHLITRTDDYSNS